MASLIRQVVKHYYPRDGDSEKIVCPFHKERSPSLVIYDHNHSFHCFGCGAGGDSIDFVMLKEDLEFVEGRDKAMQILGITFEEYGVEKKRVSDEQPVIDCHPEMDRADVVALIEATGYVANGYRGISDETNRFYGHLTKLDPNGKVLARYYPETNTNDKMAGYKCRNHPKDFTHGLKGNTGAKNQLSGQIKFKSGGKYLLIVGGEEDKAAAYEMLAESRKDKDYDPVAVVSPTAGENSCAGQVAHNYEFCNGFDFIHIGMDNDEAGRRAAEAIAKVLPKEKVKIVKWSGKDPNQMLLDGKAKQFARDFYAAKPLVATAIQNSSEMKGAVRQELLLPRIKLPHHLKPLEIAMKGGILQGRMVNIIGDTSVGKTTHVNDLVYYWFFNAPEKVGVVSLEATAAQYTIDLLSIHLEKNLLWLGDGQDILDYLDRPDVDALYDTLLLKDNGESRFAILDERDGNIKNLEAQCERLINEHGCRILVIDVLTDILRGSNADAQEDHMMWQKRILKSGVTIVNILHTKKPQNSDGTWRKATEYDAFGSSSFVQSAAINIVLSRDKMNTDPIIANLTHVDMPKCRGGITGPIMQLFFEGATRKVMNYDDYLAQRFESLTPTISMTPDIDNGPPEHHLYDPGF